MTTTTVIPAIGFGDRLRRARLDVARMTQAEFAEAIGMHQNAYGKHELSAHTPRNARMIANSVELRFGVPAWWVLGETEPHETPGVTGGYQGVLARVIPFPRRAA